jgi:hypothetical protein
MKAPTFIAPPIMVPIGAKLINAELVASYTEFKVLVKFEFLAA